MKKKYKLIIYDYCGNETQSFDFYTIRQANWFINHTDKVPEYFRYLIFKISGKEV